MSPVSELVRRLVDAQLSRNPRCRAAYLQDALFHAAVEHMRVTLQAVVETLVYLGWHDDMCDVILRDVLNRLLTDQGLAEHDALKLIAQTSQSFREEWRV